MKSTCKFLFLLIPESYLRKHISIYVDNLSKGIETGSIGKLGASFGKFFGLIKTCLPLLLKRINIFRIANLCIQPQSPLFPDAAYFSIANLYYFTFSTQKF